MKRSLRTPLRRAGDERLDGVPASAARQDRRDMLQRIEVTVDCLDGTSETEFDLPTLEQAIDEHAEDPVESCNGSYVNVVHDRMHGPLVTPNWGREFTGRIVMEDPSIGVAELYSGSLAPTHAVLDLNYKCTELLPDNNYDSPSPGLEETGWWDVGPVDGRGGGAAPDSPRQRHEALTRRLRHTLEGVDMFGPGGMEDGVLHPYPALWIDPRSRPAGTHHVARLPGSGGQTAANEPSRSPRSGGLRAR